jgi:dUTP pyrophosphatase|tara:strand:+ start:258 stop:686 length:429 start_codon:yes stop_codon:yes gene_type:complete
MIKFKRLTDTAAVPKRATAGAAGFDIYSDQDLVRVHFGQVVTISTGIAVAIPDGFVGLIKPRSGLAVSRGVDTMAGVIDSDYRGEIRVVMTVHSTAIVPFRVERGERIAQMIVVPAMLVSTEVDELDDTTRGKKGFGSTGVN